MNPIDAAWSILKADPNLRMVHGGVYPNARFGGRSQTMHPAIAGMMQGIGEGRSPIPMEDIEGVDTGFFDTHTPARYRTWPQPYSEAHGNLDSGDHLYSMGSLRSMVPVRYQGAPKTPDRLLYEMSKVSPYRMYDTANLQQIDDPSQNEEFMQAFNAYPEKLRQFYEQQGDMDVHPHTVARIAGRQDYGRIGRTGNPDNIQMIPDMMGAM
tara:strand:+ start:891 stop:1520 length:630 start_codon:yes stop_codon:yes gene_type:complete